ncbi:MAG: molybdopterin-dependent oxidoreductase, partial [Terracoccus sp.]
MTRLRFALSGILAALAGIASGHLVAAFLNPSASPVLAIGSTVIDLTPTPVKEWAIAHFGTNDKLILQGSVFVVTLLLAGVAGILSQRRRSVGVGLVAMLVVLAGAAAMSRPTATALDLVPAVVTLVVGVATLLFLLRQAGDAVPRETGTSRRGFLLGAGGITVGALLVGIGGQLMIGARTVANIALPKPKSPAEALPTGLETTVKGISPLQTPTATFYRVDTNLAVPQVDLDRWSLEIDGMVENPFTLTFAELSAMPLIERDITMTCVSNEVGGGYVGAARWLGVRLTDVLDRAGLRGRPDQVLSTAVDGFTIST